MLRLRTCNPGLADLLEVERGLAEINAAIERQRQLIEQLGQDEHDTTSSQIVFDSLCISLFLHLQSRHQLHAMLNVMAA